ncbi:Y+L amino acid transporter 2 [Halocaridina rubra]|uniref:Y+L amino acid transporter 2 n=1 Tax=Halocaridina rubra TaxID=373956 RepID=A0AAN8X061_HALRR
MPRNRKLFYAGALEGQMPEILTMIQIKRMTPAPAVLFMAFLSLAYLGSSNIYALISYVGFATWVSIGLAVACVPWLRYTAPDMVRPIKVNLIWPIIYIIATIIITIVPMFAAPVETEMTLWRSFFKDSFYMETLRAVQEALYGILHCTQPHMPAVKHTLPESSA